MDEKKIERKKAIWTSAKGVIYLVLVMVGIFGVTSFVKMVGLVSVEEEVQMKEEQAQWEDGKRVKEANGNLELAKEPEENTGIADLPLRMYLRVLDYENGILKLEVDNQSGYKMGYRESWKITREENGNWVELGIVAKQEEQKEILLLDMTKATVECDLNMLGELRTGNYKVISEDLEAEFTLVEADGE